jgi:hypothetical protein
LIVSSVALSWQNSQSTPPPLPSPRNRIRGRFWLRFKEFIVSCKRCLGDCSGCDDKGSSTRVGHDSSSKTARIVSWLAAGTLNRFTTIHPNFNSCRSRSHFGTSHSGPGAVAAHDRCATVRLSAHVPELLRGQFSRNNVAPAAVVMKHNFLQNTGRAGFPCTHSGGARLLAFGVKVCDFAAMCAVASADRQMRRQRVTQTRGCLWASRSSS